LTQSHCLRFILSRHRQTPPTAFCRFVRSAAQLWGVLFVWPAIMLDPGYIFDDEPREVILPEDYISPWDRFEELDLTEYPEEECNDFEA